MKLPKTRAKILPLISDPKISLEDLTALNAQLPKRTRTVEKVEALLLRYGCQFFKYAGSCKVFMHPTIKSRFFILSKIGCLRINSRPARNKSMLYRQRWAEYDFNTHRPTMGR